MLDGKSESQFLDKKNPRKIHWTQVYRRMHKKGIVEEIRKRRARKAVKAPRAIVGLAVDALNAKRNQTDDARKAAREAALRYVLAPQSMTPYQWQERESARARARQPPSSMDSDHDSRFGPCREIKEKRKAVRSTKVKDKKAATEKKPATKAAAKPTKVKQPKAAKAATRGGR